MSSEKTVEPTHSFLLCDVEKYGSIEKALIVKELRGMSIYKLRNGKDGYVYYSSTALGEKFPYMSASSIKRWLGELVSDGHLLTKVDNKYKYDKTISYLVAEHADLRPNWKSVDQNGPPMDQNDPTIPSLSTSQSNTSEQSSHESVEETDDCLVIEEVDDDGNPLTKPKKNRARKDAVLLEVFNCFGKKIPSWWFSNNTERTSAKSLLEERGIDQIKKAIAFYEASKDEPFCPQVLTPHDLDTKWEKLLAFRKKRA